MENLKYLNKYFFKYRVKILIGFCFIILANISSLIPANLIGRSFDLIIEQTKISDLSSVEMHQQLLLYVLLLILVAVIRGVFMFFMRQTIIVVSRFIEYDLKNDIYQKYQNLSLNFYKNNDSGDLLNRITEDVTKVRMYLGPAVMYSLNLIILIFLILSRMLFISPVLTIIVLVPLPILAFLIYKVSHRINVQSKIVQEKLSSLTNSVQEVFSGIRLVKSFVREKEVIMGFDSVSEKYMKEQISLYRVNSIFFPLILLLVGISVILTVYIGGLLVISSDTSVGQVAEFIIYVNMLTWPVTSIGWVTEVLQRASASQQRINEFLSIDDLTVFNNQNHTTNNLSHIQNEIIFSQVSYTYSSSSVEVLKEINIKLKSSTISAFVGGVGSGKSTLIQMIAGFLTPKIGEIYFDGCNANLINWNEFRKNIAYVSQDVFLFSDSIKNNILFGVNDNMDVDIVDICDKLCLLDEIESFRNGFNTYVGEGGVTLSGGQKQRIALARALIKKPKLLLLDDALSSVDSATELKIMNYIIDNFDSTTIILTSNRLSVLNYCSSVFVFDEGKLVQSGSPLELIKFEGEYRNMFFNQLRTN